MQFLVIENNELSPCAHTRTTYTLLTVLLQGPAFLAKLLGDFTLFHTLH